MSFTVFRASLRNAAVAPLRRAGLAETSSRNKLLFRNTFNRKYSTPPPSEAKSGSGLYIGIGAAAAVGLAYYYYSTASSKEAGTVVKSAVQAVKAKAKFVPSKEDYIQVDQNTLFSFFVKTLLMLFFTTV